MVPIIETDRLRLRSFTADDLDAHAAMLSDGAVIGQLGFADFKRAMEPNIEGLPELGYIFAAHAHGQGYASEAIAAALQWADSTLPHDQIVAIIDAANAPSIRVIEKAGFAIREPALYKDEPILLFRRTRAAD